MKRSPMPARKTPLKRTPMKRAHRSSMPVLDGPKPRKNRRGEAEFRRARLASFLRTDGRCIVCGKPAQHGHHRKRRSQGGPHDVENVIPLCSAHHSWVHSEPQRSYDLGLMIRASDPITPWSATTWLHLCRGDVE